MLILSRNRGESIIIGDDDIEIAVIDINGGQVKIGIRAPRDVSVDRKEIYLRKAAEGITKPSGILGSAATHALVDELHVDDVVKLAAGEYRRLRPGIDYDRDSVCPGCGCFRDRCACDLREASISTKEAAR